MHQLGVRLSRVARLQLVLACARPFGAGSGHWQRPLCELAIALRWELRTQQCRLQHSIGQRRDVPRAWRRKALERAAAKLGSRKLAEMPTTRLLCSCYNTALLRKVSILCLRYRGNVAAAACVLPWRARNPANGHERNGANLFAPVHPCFAAAATQPMALLMPPARCGLQSGCDLYSAFSPDLAVLANRSRAARDTTLLPLRRSNRT